MEFIITRKKLEKKVSFDKIKLHQAEVAKSVDAPDSKSGVAHPTCRFESGLRHILQALLEESFFCG